LYEEVHELVQIKLKEWTDFKKETVRHSKTFVNILVYMQHIPEDKNLQGEGSIFSL